MHFSLKQVNELITGIQLAAELPAKTTGHRRFISLLGYSDNGRPDKFINDVKKEQLCFLVRDYEYPAEYLENDWDDGDEDEICRNYFYRTGIHGIGELEQVLAERIADFSQFVPIWETDAPI